MINIEFFHDTICSFCFPMSYRMRELKKQRPDINIIHRSFALVPSPEDFDIMFGNRQVAKQEIISHWKQANENDDLHRFNIKGMEKTTFLFPYSMPALFASKAAFFVDGEEAYWDVFDALQYAFFVQNRNIEDSSVIQDCVKTTNVSFEKWQEQLQKPETEHAVLTDFELVKKYNITSVPSLVINEKFKVSGALTLDQINEVINQAN